MDNYDQTGCASVLHGLIKAVNILYPYIQRWQKLTKYHWQNFEPEELAHKICATQTQNFAKIPKIAHTKCKKILETACTNHKLAQL